ncbi:hypothetical protein NDU88_004382 [Pleurodeles waltl]|uniref:Uncharacterized protein n=1 Tax=Pleurodeles waltl TaxID=8319 RepID=A0AAV7SIL4_PLEWA|nr:hypothetical protein NDU88_004382 [Pleurodeles waltl]
MQVFCLLGVGSPVRLGLVRLEIDLGGRIEYRPRVDSAWSARAERCHCRRPRSVANAEALDCWCKRYRMKRAMSLAASPEALQKCDSGRVDWGPGQAGEAAGWRRNLRGF